MHMQLFSVMINAQQQAYISSYYRTFDRNTHTVTAFTVWQGKRDGAN